MLRWHEAQKQTMTNGDEHERVQACEAVGAALVRSRRAIADMAELVSLLCCRRRPPHLQASLRLSLTGLEFSLELLKHFQVRRPLPLEAISNEPGSLFRVVAFSTP